MIGPARLISSRFRKEALKHRMKGSQFLTNNATKRLKIWPLSSLRNLTLAKKAYGAGEVRKAPNRGAERQAIG
jgi:hypothetical protein